MPSQISTPSGALAPRRAPEPYMRAEVATFPLTSLEAFRQAIVALDPELDEYGTRRLWRSCEQEFTQHAAGLSLDRMVAIRDRTWFGAPGRPIRMHEYLRRLVEAHIDARYGVAELRQEDDARAARGGGETIDAVLHYRWLTFSVPEDLLLAAVRRDPPPYRVNQEHRLFDRHLLDVGLAEIHQHKGAGWDFPLLWVGAMAALANSELDLDMSSPGAPFDNGRLLARWMLVSAIARVVMMEFLLSRRMHGARGGLRHFVEARAESAHSHARHTLRRVLRALAETSRDPDAKPPEIEALQWLYGDLHPMALRIADNPPKRCADAWRCDPIAVRLDLHDYHHGERWLVRHGLAYLESGDPDPYFERAFWQSQRIRCQYYRYVVQRPMTAGLQWFIRFYERIGFLRTPLDHLQPEASFRPPQRARSVTAALEIRSGMEGDARSMADRLRRLVLSWRNALSDTLRRGPEPEFGVVMEFSKQRDPLDYWKKGRPTAHGEHTYAQPYGAPYTGGESAFKSRSEAWHARFRQFLANQAPGARATADLLGAVPLSLWLVRGVDVCTDELGVPTWVLTPLFWYVRQESRYASILLPLSERAPALQTTAHVGEDFRHLMEGMRRIYEAISYLLDRTGARLGHAVALGIEPRQWAESIGAVLMPAEDRLWDLVFEWRIYTGFGIPADFAAVAPPGRIERVQNLIADLAERVWPGGFESASGERHCPSSRELAELHDRLHRFMVPVDRPMTRGGLHHALERGIWRLSNQNVVDRALRAYLEDPDLFRRGQQLVDVPLDQSEVQALYAVQEALRRGVAQRGIVVEVNPTSNLLIGDILDLRHHPLLRLFPVEPDDTIPPVPIAIGSDDPITFSTSLTAEYSIMYDIARAAGYPALTVGAWLEQIRRTAFDARFTRAWRPDAQTMSEKLLAKFEKFLQVPTSRSQVGSKHCVG